MIWSQFCVGHSNRLNLKRRRCRWYGGYLLRSSGNSYKWCTFFEWSPCGCRIRQMVSAYQMIDEAILWQFKSSVKWLLGRVVLGKNYILSLALLSLYPKCGNGPLDYMFMFPKYQEYLLFFINGVVWRSYLKFHILWFTLFWLVKNPSHWLGEVNQGIAFMF